jgi:hypothetical protein
VPTDAFGASNKASTSKVVAFGSDIALASAARRRREMQAAIANNPFAVVPSLMLIGGRPFLFDVTASPYNAAGDGSTDDTSAIQSAIDAAGANGGGIVLFPPGHYVITAPLQINYSGIIIQGAGITAGAGGTTIYPGPNIDCFVGAAYPSAETVGFCIRDLHIDWPSYSTTGGSAIKIQWADRCWFERILISGCFNALTIGQGGVSVPTINEVWFDKIDIVNASGAIIDLHGIGGDVFVTDLVAIGINTSTSSYALQFNNSSYDVLWLNHIDFEGVYGGMDFTCVSSSSPASSLSDFFISDIIVDAADGAPALNFASGGTTGNIGRGKIRNFWASGQGGGAGGVTCFINGQGGGSIRDLNFSGCNFECSTGSAVMVFGAASIVFENCQVYNSLHGFDLEAGSDLVIQGCTNGAYSPCVLGVVLGSAMTGTYSIHDNDWNNVTSAVSNNAPTSTNQISRLENNTGYNPVGILSPPPAYTSGSATTNPYPFAVMVVVSGASGVSINGTNTGAGAGSYFLGRGQDITPFGSGSWTWFGL